MVIPLSDFFLASLATRRRHASNKRKMNMLKVIVKIKQFVYAYKK